VSEPLKKGPAPSTPKGAKMSSESESGEVRLNQPTQIQKVLQFRTLVLVLARGLLEVCDTGSISDGVRRDLTDAAKKAKKRG